MGGASSIVRTRFAPSPSGHLHVGGARTALYCWAFARKQNGRFLLRIEDTDVKRSSEAASLGFLEDLKWLGILWDEGPEHDGCGGGDAGPYFQSQRLDIYNRYVDQLLREGKAYCAFETPAELDAEREAARKAGRNYRYSRASLKLSKAHIDEFLREGRAHVIRFKAPDDREVLINDEVLGPVRTAPGELDDFVIRKADGYPTYHFAVVVDDELMGVTHVIRAQEHLNNTPRHVLLQDALGFRRPVYAHISVIQNPDGSKMSKRDKAKVARAEALRFLSSKSPEQRSEWVSSVVAIDRLPTDLLPQFLQRHRQLFQPVDHIFSAPELKGFLESFLESESDEAAIAELIADVLDIELPEIEVDDFRRHGYLPEVLVNYLALLGWSPGGDVEKFNADFLIERFDLDRVQKSPARFDRNKLLAFNLDALQGMNESEFVERLHAHAAEYHQDFLQRLGPARFELFARANKARSKTLEDPFKHSRFFVQRDDEIVYQQSKAVNDALLEGEPSGYAHLEALLPMLRDVSEWTEPAVEAVVKRYADEHAQGKLGKIAQPLRIAVSGGTISPAIFDTLAILGRESTLNRIERCLSQRHQASGISH